MFQVWKKRGHRVHGLECTVGGVMSPFLEHPGSTLCGQQCRRYDAGYSSLCSNKSITSFTGPS